MVNNVKNKMKVLLFSVETQELCYTKKQCVENAALFPFLIAGCMVTTIYTYDISAFLVFHTHVLSCSAISKYLNYMKQEKFSWAAVILQHLK